MGLGHDRARRQIFELVVTPNLAPVPRTRQSVAQSQHVAGHVVAHLFFDPLAGQRVDRLRTSGDQLGKAGVEERLIPRGEPLGVVISGAAQHRTVQMHQVLSHLLVGGDAAVDDDRELREVAF